MHSRLSSLAWEIWLRNRRMVWVPVGVLIFGCVFNRTFGDGFRLTEDGRGRLLFINGLMLFASIVSVFAIFNYTEFEPRRGWTGFPYRLFTTPVPTWLLVGLPVTLGVLAAEAVYVLWLKLVLTHHELAMPGWLGVLIGAYMVFYLTVLWTLAGFRTLRILTLGLLGTGFIAVAVLPRAAVYVPSPWLTQARLVPLVLASASVAALVGLVSVGRQRAGGRRTCSGWQYWWERAVDCLPQRHAGFSSGAAAQFWFEWRQNGLVLPGCVGVILAGILGPLSWSFRNDSGATFWLLGWTLLMPILLAMPLGKGFSKPIFWSMELSLPPFMATRPISAGDLVVSKLKVAALSTSLAWVVVIAFLSLWLPLWANLEALSMLRVGFWMSYGHSTTPQYAMAALLLVCFIVMTWRLLVNGLWAGLSGSRVRFIAPIIGWCLIILAAVIILALLLNDDEVTRAWFRANSNQILGYIEWTAAAGVLLKFSIAVYSWRNINTRPSVFYLLCWIGGTLCFVSLSLLIWAHGMLALALTALFDFLPFDIYRLRSLLLLLSLLAFPLARIGLSPAALAANRSGQPLRKGNFAMNKILFTPALCVAVLAVFLATLHQDFRWVDAGGHSVRVLELGGAGPTVVFEAGAGGPLESWARVQPAVSTYAHTIAYDRAGNGLSPLGPVPRDGRQIARELHTLLHNASAQPPYILVGHSLGGPDIRMFASLYPSEVGGLVLVDPTQEDLIAWAKAREPQPQTPRRLRLDDEVDCARLTFAELKTNKLSAEVPIVLISGLGPREMPGFLSEQLKAEVQKDRESLYPAKLKFHKAWVEQFARGRLLTTENSGHGIPWEEPELLTAAIRQVVKRAGAQSNPSSSP